MTRCASCGFENPPAMKFCGGCGRPLAVAPPVEAERRQLTVMFCDLVGSAALADVLDPEELRDLVRAYQQAAGEAIRAFDGHVAQHLGDGLLVYFGYPIAHEDDARRAVHAALAVLDRIDALNTTLPPGRALALRIGIHTGPVVAGEIGAGESRERLALGPTPNIAARLQEIAQRDTVVVSRQTRDLLKDLFVCESLGARTLKGFAQPVEAFRVAGRVGAAVASRSLTPMIGRHHELDALIDALAQAREGRGRATMIVAEAGLGKSRLVQAFQEHALGRRCDWYAANCSPYEQASALRPVAACVEQVLSAGMGEAGPPRDRTLVAGIERAGLDPREAVPLVAGLLGAPIPEPFAPSDLSPQKQRTRTLEIAAALLTAGATANPAVLLVEDLHWADPSTVEFLRVLIPRCVDVPLLALLTSRPAGAPPFDAGVGRLALAPVGAGEVAEIAAAVARGKRLPRRVVDQIVEKTDGVPLFVEELTKTILESGAVTEEEDRFELTGDAGALAIPLSLQASLIARLDRLPAGKDVAQLASVIGREFSVEMLNAVAGRPAEDLTRALDHLVDAGLIYPTGTPPRARYLFKHALVRDAAYEMLLKSTRREYHYRIAGALLDRFRDIADARPELVAQHLTEADRAEAAVEYWLRAGQNAMRQSANQEAEVHFRRGLALVEGLPASPGRDQVELAYLTSLGTVLLFTHGYTAPEVEQTYRRAMKVNERIGDDSKNFWITAGLWTYRMVRGEVDDGHRLAEDLLAAARAAGDRTAIARAAGLASWSRYFRGEFTACRECTELVLANQKGLDEEYLRNLGADLCSTAEVIGAMACWNLGAWAEADAATERALALVRDSPHAYSVAVVLVRVVEVAHFGRDVARVRQYAAQLAGICERHGFPVWGWNAVVWLAWADAMEPETPTGIGAGIDPVAVLDGVKATGATLAVSYFCTLSAETLIGRGRRADAERLMERALALIGATGDRHWAAETYRVKAAMILDAGDAGVSEAEGFLVRAVDVARAQGARSLQLRAAVDLGNLWRRLGREADARALVAESCAMFPPEADSPDLAAARAFLVDAAAAGA